VFEDKGAHDLKGVPAPVALYRVVRASGGGRRGGARALTPLVGRQDELVLHMRRWARALEGEGQFAQIVGEPGLGKSRLVEEFRANLPRPLLAPLVDIPPREDRQTRRPPDELRRRQLAAMTSWVLAGARTQPVVLAFQDLHGPTRPRSISCARSPSSLLCWSSQPPGQNSDRPARTTASFRSRRSTARRCAAWPSRSRAGMRSPTRRSIE